MYGLNHALNGGDGSKAQGLARLRAFQATIPETWVITPDCRLGSLKSIDGRSFAVRSSSNKEDGQTASYAGQYKTYLNVATKDLAEMVQRCRDHARIASVVGYESALGVGEGGPNKDITVIVQAMIDLGHAGVVFTGDPETGNRDTVLIEYVNGLGDQLVGGTKSPDGSFKITDEKWPSRKPGWWTGLRQVVWQARVLEGQFGMPLDLEWNANEKEVYFLQARPITGVKWWIPGMRGEAVGHFDVVRGVVQRAVTGRAFEAGNILVARMTAPSMVHDMIKAAAIITEIGGRTCHAAIIARELGKPCIVGCAKAKRLVDGMIVEVNAETGEVQVVNESS